MNLQEFKAWFEGFTENMKGAPSEKAWKRIQERVAEITANPTEIRYFYDYYWRPMYSGSVGGTYPYYSGSMTNVAGQNSSCGTTYTLASTDMPEFQNSGQAFNALGRIDAEALA